jgi:hypothetical protein
VKRTRIQQRSEARATDGYGEWVRTQLRADSRCHVGPMIRSVAPGWRGCTGRAQGMHHLRKQSAGGVRISEANTLRSCNPCNGWVEDHPDEAEEAGLVVGFRHPLYEALGRRAAREAS